MHIGQLNNITLLFSFVRKIALTYINYTHEYAYVCVRVC